MLGRGTAKDQVILEEIEQYGQTWNRDCSGKWQLENILRKKNRHDNR